MDYTQLDFETLWQLLKENDELAWAEFLKRFEPLIKSRARVNGSVDEDIAQDIREALVRAFKKRASNCW